MRRPAAFALALALGAATAPALVSCGGGEDAKLLPGTTAQEITENLDQVKQLANEGECVGATDAVQEVSTQVETLGGVDPKLKEALQRGTARLGEVVATCDEATTEAVEPETPTIEEEEKAPPGQEKKEEKEKEKEKPPKESPPPHGPPATTPPETTPPSPPTETAPPEESGGTGAPGGVGPGSAVGGED